MASLPLYGRSILSLPSHYRNLSHSRVVCAAIALVFTAKSIARYDMISKNQGFAEYYLIGSLFSMISVLVTYALLIF